ncbi:MAG: CARDB domain-containing protein [Candidatus Aenigmatarchaeota archaeon]|nr:hypothetical protein [Candidatus Aenigmarchaeota archaeon]
MKSINILICMLLFSFSTFAADTISTTASIYPSVLSPGTEGYIQFTITNTGINTITDMRILSVIADAPILIQSPGVQTLGSLNPGSSYSTNIKFTVPSYTSSGYYVVRITTEVCYGVSCKNYLQNAIIAVQAPSLVEIKSITPYEMKIGKTEKFTFTIKNNGDSDITNVILTWYDPSNVLFPLGESNKIYIPKINAYETYNVSTNLGVSSNALSGYHNIFIIVQYTDKKGVIQFVNNTLGIKILGNYNFIFSKESQDIIQQGKSGLVSIKIANAGTQDAKFLTQKLITDDKEISVSPSIIYVGNLKTDDFDTEKYTITTYPWTKIGYHNLTMIIEYQDEFGNTYSENHTFTIYVSESNVSFDNLKNLIILIVIGIIIYYFYNKRVKKKR